MNKPRTNNTLTKKQLPFIDGGFVRGKLVSVNILTYNAQDLIEPCLKSALDQTYKNIEILVIDNASVDNTKKIIQNSKFKRAKPSQAYQNFRFIENSINLGYTGGHNVGIRKSKGEYILCLAQDVVLDKDFIKEAVRAMETDGKIAAIQGKLYKSSEQGVMSREQIDTTGLLIFKNRRVVNIGQGEKDKGQYDKTEEIFGADGAAPLYRRKALEDIKINNEYFDEDLFMYKEDIDLAWRLELYGWKAVYQPKALAYHLRSAGEKAVRDYVSVALVRRKISKFAKFYSFKNDRLIRIKNELLGLFFRDIFYILIKEAGAWAYVLIFEHYTCKAIKSLINQIPNAWRKRKIIMAKKRVNAKQMARWFK